MKRPELNTQQDALKYFFETMDAEMIDAFLDGDKSESEEHRAKSFRELQELFDKFAASGDTHLIAVQGKCSNCFIGGQGFTFMGNNSRNYISILFLKKGKRIKTLHECFSMRNSKYKLNLKNQFTIGNDE